MHRESRLTGAVAEQRTGRSERIGQHRQRERTVYLPSAPADRASHSVQLAAGDDLIVALDDAVHREGRVGGHREAEPGRRVVAVRVEAEHIAGDPEARDFDHRSKRPVAIVEHE